MNRYELRGLLEERLESEIHDLEIEYQLLKEV